MRIDPACPIAVFLGPSLPLAAARGRLAANYLPPVRMGDIYRLLASGIDTIAIIDGVFHQSTPVWPREILSALEEGIRVIGGASMGALRAAELARYGMHGVGTIFGWYRDGVIDGDDEVALVHVEGSLGYQPLSEPLVNLRHALARAEARALLTADEREAMTAWLAASCFIARSRRALRQSPAWQALPGPRQHTLEEFLDEDRADLKRDDALAVLAACAESTPPASPPHVPWSYPGTVRWQLQSAVTAEGHLVEGERVLRAAVAADSHWAEAAHRAVRRDFFLRAWLRECAPGAEPSVPAASAAFLRANGLTAREYVESSAAQARLAWLRAQTPVGLGVDETRATSLEDLSAIEAAVMADWAARRGIVAPAGDTVHWLIASGPTYFGHTSFIAEAEMLRMLQMEGRAATLAESLARRPPDAEAAA